MVAVEVVVTVVVMALVVVIDVNPKGWGSRSPRFWDGRVAGSPCNIIISCNLHE